MPLTEQEKRDLDWGPGEKYALVNMITKSMFLTSDTLEPCLSALNRMTMVHPRYAELELVIKPNEEERQEAL